LAPRALALRRDLEKACRAFDAGWVAVSRLREALAKILVVWTNASAGVGRSEKIMPKKAAQEGPVKYILSLSNKFHTIVPLVARSQSYENPP
jgi:hypothetical protein